MLIFLLLIVVAGMFMPLASLVSALPALWVIQAVVAPKNPSIFAVGPVDVVPVDLAFGLILIRITGHALRTRRVAWDRGLYLALAGYAAVSLIATLFGWLKFGDSQLIRGLTAEARVVQDMLLVPVMATAAGSLFQIRRCVQILAVTLVFLVLIQFWNALGISGWTIGEVQGGERGQHRYFGPVGDSIGFVLLLGYAVGLCSGSILGILVFASAIALTAGIGSLIALGVISALYVAGCGLPLLRSPLRLRVFAAFGCMACIGGGLLVAGSGGAMDTLSKRLSSGDYQQSASQRMRSAALALAIIEDNPVLGVGFQGYESAIVRYGGAFAFNLDRPDGATANANSQILQVLTDGGVLAALAFLALVWASLKTLWGAAQLSEEPLIRGFFLGASLWLVGEVVGNLTACWILPSSFQARLLWICAGLAVGLREVTAKPRLRM